MSEQLWVVRAGEGAKHVDQVLTSSRIAIGFDDVTTDDLSAMDADQIRALATSPTEKQHAAQLITFAFKMQLGDLVIIPRITKAHRDYIVARVVGPYEYHAEPSDWGQHRRQVSLLGTFARELVTGGATGSLGGIATVFRPTKGEAEIRGLLTSLQPMPQGDPFPTVTQALADLHVLPETVGTAPIAVAAPTRPLATAHLEIGVDPAGKAKIVSPYPALIMEQTPRHVPVGTDWVGVPGIYVLTGTELDQSVQRTGPERTLTMTSIVRPWAYVGLSEDFHGRMGSHRNQKEEWRRALLVRSGAQPFSSDDIKYLEARVYEVLAETQEVAFNQSVPRGNLSAQPRHTDMLDACAETIVAVLRLTGTLI